MKLSEICTIEKGATGITKAIEGQYPMVTMAEARISHNEYQFDTKAVLIPLVSSSGHGHASMKRLHYQEGKFALGSILCALVPKNEEEVNARFLYNYLHFQRESILVPLMRGAANVSLSIKSIATVEINLPPIETQISINKLVDDFKIRQDVFQTELKTQANLLSKLRQAYLQEAVMGKLTEPSQDDAKTLLADIKSQKAQLIKEGKLRKEKPLPPIKPEEIPFEIPDNWVWCRLGEILNVISGNNFESTSFTNKEGIKVIKITNTGVGELIETDDFLPFDFEEKYNNFLVYSGELLIALTRPYIADGLKICLCSDAYDKSLLNQRVALLRTGRSKEENLYIYFFMRTDFILNLFKSKYDGKSQQPNLKIEDISSLLIPLPPLSEQKAIVEKVEGLLANISLLDEENKIQQNEVQRLMGAVLQEAFGGR